MDTESSGITFNNMSGFVLESVLDIITDSLKIAGTYGGRVFGGFMRDVIVPRMFNPKCQVKFKDVDIWFTSQENAKAFVCEMGRDLKLMIDVQPENTVYKFQRQQYYLYKYDTCVAWIDVVVSETIPVNDFNINRLTCCYTQKTKQFESYGPENKLALMDAIKNKCATMLPEYEEFLSGQYRSCHVQRLNRIYLQRGWNVYCSTRINCDGGVLKMEPPDWMNQLRRPYIHQSKVIDTIDTTGITGSTGNIGCITPKVCDNNSQTLKVAQPDNNPRIESTTSIKLFPDSPCLNKVFASLFTRTINNYMSADDPSRDVFEDNTYHFVNKAIKIAGAMTCGSLLRRTSESNPYSDLIFREVFANIIAYYLEANNYVIRETFIYAVTRVARTIAATPHLRKMYELSIEDRK